MEAKLFEVRDRATFIPVLAVRMGSLAADPDNRWWSAELSLEAINAERWLLARAGFGLTSAEQARYVQLVQINGGGGLSQCDPYGWPGRARTMTVAHLAIISRWDDLPTGSVIDVRYESGDAAAPCASERTPCSGDPSDW